MPKLMLKFNSNISFLFVLLISSITSTKAQNLEILEQVNYLLNDAVYYADKFITPATDASVYQASSGWMNTTKKKEFGEISLGIHGNLFLVPKSDRKFNLSNENLDFFTIQGENSLQVPTAIGNNEQYYLTGDLDGNEVRLKTPEGVNEETVFYSYLQGSVGLWYGTEFTLRFSPKTKLKKGDYQVYGAAIKHNLDQYFSNNFNKSIHVSALLAYSKENLSFDFVSLESSAGSIGINSLSSLVDTYQAQISISKTHKNLEVMWGLIYNLSNFDYEFGGQKGSIEEIIPLQDILNQRMESLTDTRSNLIGEFSGRYQFSKFFVQGTVAFGKFVNTNLGLQYEF